MVCSRGESLTTHRNQMKLFKAIAAAVVIGGSLLIPNPAKAQYLDLSSLNFDQCMEKFESYYYCEKFHKDGAAGQAVSGNGCPPGTRQHQKTALFGLIKGRTLCLSDYEAESLRAQQQRDIQNNTRNSQPRFVNCTSNIYGNFVSTSCY